MPNLSLLPQPRQRLHGCVKRNRGVRHMQLIHIDPLQPQPLQASLHGRLQVLRRGIVGPLPRAHALPSTFGRDHQARRIRRQRLRDQFFRDIRTIRIRRVDKVDTQLDCAPQRIQGRAAILRRTPYPLAGNPHRTVSHAVDGKVAQLNGSCRRSRDGLRNVAHDTNSPSTAWQIRSGPRNSQAVFTDWIKPRM